MKRARSALLNISTKRSKSSNVIDNNKHKESQYYAAFAQASYEDDPAKYLRTKIADPWLYDKSLSSKNTQVFTRDDQVVTVHRGTKEFTDLITDMSIIKHEEYDDPRFQEAERHFKRVLKKYPNSVHRLAGHSLGGSLNNHIFRRHGSHIDTVYNYNAGQNFVDLLSGTPDRVHNYTIKGDLVSALSRGKEQYEKSDSTKDAHTISQFVSGDMLTQTGNSYSSYDHQPDPVAPPVPPSVDPNAPPPVPPTFEPGHTFTQWHPEELPPGPEHDQEDPTPDYFPVFSTPEEKKAFYEETLKWYQSNAWRLKSQEYRKRGYEGSDVDVYNLGLYDDLNSFDHMLTRTMESFTVDAIFTIAGGALGGEFGTAMNTAGWSSEFVDTFKDIIAQGQTFNEQGIADRMATKFQREKEDHSGATEFVAFFRDAQKWLVDFLFGKDPEFIQGEDDGSVTHDSEEMSRLWSHNWHKDFSEKDTY